MLDNWLEDQSMVLKTNLCFKCVLVIIRFNSFNMRPPWQVGGGGHGNQLMYGIYDGVLPFLMVELSGLLLSFVR